MGNKMGVIKFAMASLFVAGSTFLLNYSLLQFLDKHSYGIWSYNVGLAILLFAMVFEWIRVGALRLGVSNTRWDGYYSALYSFVYLIVIVSLVALAALLDDLWMLGIYLTFHCLHEFAVTKYRMYDRKDLYTTMQIIKGAVFLLAVLFMVGFRWQEVEVCPVIISLYIVFLYLIFFLIFFHTKKGEDAVAFKMKFSAFRMKRFSKYASLFFVNSSIALGFFFVDRPMLKYIGLDEMISDNSAVMELVKQFIMFPMNIVSVFLYNKEISISGDANLYSKFLVRKSVLLIGMLTLVFMFFVLFNIFWSSLYFPSSYIGYWEDVWLWALLAVSLYSLKVYFFDQFFISVNKIRFVVFSNLLLFFGYIVAFVVSYMFFHRVDVFESMLISVFISIVCSAVGFYLHFSTEKKTLVLK